jgi:hypothetical protein
LSKLQAEVVAIEFVLLRLEKNLLGLVGGLKARKSEARLVQATTTLGSMRKPSWARATALSYGAELPARSPRLLTGTAALG